MTEDPIVTVSFGPAASQQFPLSAALMDLAIELLIQRNDLRHQQIYAPENPDVEIQRDARVADLERLHAALESVAWQMLFPGEMPTRQSGDFIALARQHGVTLPAWLRGLQRRPPNPRFRPAPRSVSPPQRSPGGPEMNDEPRYVVPIGSLAGEAHPIAEVILVLAIEVYFQDVLLRFQQGKAPQNPAVEIQRNTHIADLERTFLDLISIAWQLYPENDCGVSHNLIQFIRQYHFILPAWVLDPE